MLYIISRGIYAFDVIYTQTPPYAENISIIKVSPCNTLPGVLKKKQEALTLNAS